MTADTTGDVEPRAGLLGSWDRVVGPAASPAETTLTLGAMALGPALAAAGALLAGAHWPWWRWLIVSIIAGDLFGGLVCNALPACKRWRHRQGQTRWKMFGFCALHVHPLVLALAVPQATGWRVASLAYGLLLAGGVLVIATPGALKSAAGLGASAIATLVCAHWLPLTAALGWVPPILFLKVLAAHLVPPAGPQA